MLSARPTRQTQTRRTTRLGFGNRMITSKTATKVAPKKNLKRKRNVGQEGDYEDEDDDFEPHDEEYEVEVKTSPAKTNSKVSTKSKPASASHLYTHLNTNPHSTTKHVLLSKTVYPIREALLRWYAGVHTDRGMPWRKKFDASLGRVERAQRGYEVWISEIMLQQTQVATVIPYYNRWMSKFPTIKDLASSTLDTVHALWKGLGYYSRATRLLEGAKVVMRDFGGLFPDNAKDMMKHIPGIGRYSAGAISSIAFGREEPVLDGNTIRLLTRLLALHANPKSKGTLNVLWDAAAAMVEGAERPGDVNQALIELGSTVCKVKSPACETCPIGTWCLAREESKGVESSKAEEKDIEDLCTICEPYTSESQTRDVTIYPMKVEKKKAREETDLVCVVEWRGSKKKDKSKDKEDRWFLLVRRPEKGLLANLHEFPTIANVSGEVASSSAEQRRAAQELLKELLSDEETVGEYVKEVRTLKGFSAAKTKSARKVAKGGKSEVGVVIDVDAEAAEAKSEERLGVDSKSRSGPGISLKIEDIRPVGDVLHVFSHIRKTYGVLWVVLSGTGTEPPRLRRDYGAASTGASESASEGKTKSKSGRKKARVEADDEETEYQNREDVLEEEKDDSNITSKMNLRWVKMEDVADANIGTGVMKIWKKVRSLWEA